MLVVSAMKEPVNLYRKEDKCLKFSTTIVDPSLSLIICIFVNAYLFYMSTCLYTLILQLAYNLLEGNNCLQFISICTFPSGIKHF